MHCFALLLLLLSVSFTDSAFELPSGADEILKDPLNKDFSCDDRPYGYYADTNNNCQLFHICLPIENAEGEVGQKNECQFYTAFGLI